VTGGVQSVLVVIGAILVFWWQRKNLRDRAHKIYAARGCLGCFLYVTLGLLAYFLVGGIIAWIVER
jgi:asparagine N-glycosylation enzyme membrane subunit Stt3